MWELWGGRNFGLPIDLVRRLYNCLLLSHKPWCKPRMLQGLGSSPNSMLVTRISPNLFRLTRGCNRLPAIRILKLRFFSEIFAVKVESCPKSRRFLDVFDLPNFNGPVPSPKTSYTRVIIITYSSTSRDKCFVKLLPLAPTLLSLLRYIFSQFLSSLWKKIVRKTPVRVESALARLGRSVASVNFFGGGRGRSTFYMVFPKSRCGRVHDSTFKCDN